MKASGKKRNAHFLNYSLGLIYFWFGLLKLFPGLSPAEILAEETIGRLTFHLIPAQTALFLLACLEVGIGLILLLNRFHKIAIPMATGHILLTFTPFLLMPELVFSENPLFLTLTGQYIVKNIILLSVLLYLWKEYQLVLPFPRIGMFIQKALS